MARTNEEKIGLALAISSSAFIGASFVLTKTGLRRASEKGASANNGGYGYLREPIWWMGLVSMVVGELANFTAYGFAPPILVTPMGAFTVIVSAALSVCLLGESLPRRAWFGMLLCIVGAVVVVVNSPGDPQVDSMDDMEYAVLQLPFLVYAGATFSLAAVLALCVAPHYARSCTRQDGELVVLVLICSLVGSMSVLSCKALSIDVRSAVTAHEDPFTLPTLLAALLVVVCVLLQLNYLNRALDSFGTSRVSPVYYVFFTTLTLVAAFVLFQEWRRTSFSDGVCILMGLASIALGVKLLHDEPQEKWAKPEPLDSLGVKLLADTVHLA